MSENLNEDLNRKLASAAVYRYPLTDQGRRWRQGIPVSEAGAYMADQMMVITLAGAAIGVLSKRTEAMYEFVEGPTRELMLFIARLEQQVADLREQLALAEIPLPEPEQHDHGTG